MTELDVVIIVLATLCVVGAAVSLGVVGTVIVHDLLARVENERGRKH